MLYISIDADDAVKTIAGEIRRTDAGSEVLSVSWLEIFGTATERSWTVRLPSATWKSVPDDGYSVN